MKDWRECKKISYKIKRLQVQGEPYNMKHWNFSPCDNCDEECNNKARLNAQNKAMRAISKI